MDESCNKKDDNDITQELQDRYQVHCGSLLAFQEVCQLRTIAFARDGAVKRDKCLDREG